MQRIDRLEKQVQQMQRQVFPRGRPADTAGFTDEPAATQTSVLAISQRLDSLERQMSELVRISEENANRMRAMASDLERSREDDRRRLDAVEQRLAAGLAPVVESNVEPARTTVVSDPPRRPPVTAGAASEAAVSQPAEDPGEAAYTEGFKLWEAGRYDDAITSLRAFVSAYPKHRRVSFANNLVGRALLDKGEAKAAVPAFVANYRGNPAGERAPDSLYYLGQALMRLGQASQACNAYAELDEVYGAKMRADLKKLQDEAKQQAQCKN